MSTYKIKATKSTANLKRAMDRMDWKDYVIAEEISNKYGRTLFEVGSRANLEGWIDDGDEVIVVDEDGKEVERATFAD